MFSWRDTGWYWLIGYTDLKSVSKPPWYLRSSHHLRSQSQFKHLLLEDLCFWRKNRWEADFQSLPGQPHDLYRQPQLRSRFQQIWIEVSRVVFFCLIIQQAALVINSPPAENFCWDKKVKTSKCSCWLSPNNSLPWFPNLCFSPGDKIEETWLQTV